MGILVNPFAELYVGETVPPRDFVTLFSPFLVEHALLLFQRGNVVLTGVQGSGKTMLLSLLRPSIRLAFEEARAPFPVPSRDARFISAGISLRHSGVLSFGQRAFNKDPEIAKEVTPLFFADYLNHFLVLDLLEALELLTQSKNAAVARNIGLVTSPVMRDVFARELAMDPCWLGSLSDVGTFEALKQQMARRLSVYTDFLQFNLRTLPDEVAGSKTTAGVPVSRAASILRSAGVAEKDVNVFVRVDQYEELDGLKRLPAALGTAFREIINRIIGMRDPHVFYRVGARRHAWRANLRMYGSLAGLEHQREYEEIDLEEILRRPENIRTYVFMRFAADVTRRRLSHAGYACDVEGARLIKDLFPPIPAVEKARRYIGPTDGPLQPRARDAIGIEDSWPAEWKESVEEAAVGDPLEARLEAAWIAQQLRRGKLPHLPPRFKSARGWTREYWRKERVPQALMQLAHAGGQRIIWAGHRDIEALAGGNILVYASIVKHVWAAWLRTSDQTSTLADGMRLPVFDAVSQTAGIEEASFDWFRKVAEQPGGGTRQKFIVTICRHFVTGLLSDTPMSYPGHNGFSVADEEVEQDPVLWQWLNQASDYGDLVEVAHTTKERDRRSRRKYYVQPILSPHLRIPAVHVKEPLYVSVTMVKEWLGTAEGQGRTGIRRHELPAVNEDQLPLI